MALILQRFLAYSPTVDWWVRRPPPRRGRLTWWLDGDGQFWAPLERLVTLLDVEGR